MPRSNSDPSLQIGRGIRGFLAALLFAITLPVHAITVTYQWQPDPGQGGEGWMTFDSPSITDPANFALVNVNALVGLFYKWDNGAIINYMSIQTNNAPSWTASGGYLITGFQITANEINNTPGIYSLTNSAGLPGNPGPAFNGTNSVFFGAEGNSGKWVLAPPTVIPVPGAVWLFGSAVAGLAFLRRRSYNR